MIGNPHSSPDGLSHSLKQRHMTMIALGGVIGAGLFVGSGVVIKSAGPAAVISFLITGLLVVGLAVLLFSWIRVNHRHDPYKDIQR